jgi:hypothetical protein
MFLSEAIVSSSPRVFNPQSGLIHYDHAQVLHLESYLSGIHIYRQIDHFRVVFYGVKKVAALHSAHSISLQLLVLDEIEKAFPTPDRRLEMPK